MPSCAYSHFQKNLETVTRLQRTFEESKSVKNARGEKGRGAFDHITRSAIVFLISAFEVYCEEIICECCDKLIESAKDAEKLPHQAKNAINDYVKNDSNHVPPTSLCDEGWRKVYHDLVVLQTSRLNTPNTKNLSDLCSKYLGLSNSLFNAIENIDRLDTIIKFRGEITHQVKAEKYVRIDTVKEYKEIISKIVVGMDKCVRNHIKNACHVKAPWNDTYDLRKN